MLCALTAASPTLAQEDGAGTSPAGLEGLFEIGRVFQDRNGDDFVDFVATGIILGEDRSDAELAAAIDVAARLGFETMAMNLPLARDIPADGVGIVIGRSGLARLGLSVPALDRLADGEGLITRVALDGRSWVVIAGADDIGTRAAAAAFAGRLPHMGEVLGKTLAEMLTDLEEYLTVEGLAPASLHVAAVRVGGTTDGAFDAVEVEVAMPSGADVTQVRAALGRVPALREEARVAAEVDAEDGGADHATDDAATDDDDGNDGEEDDGSQLLSYPGARLLRVSIAAADGASASVEIPAIEPEAPSKPTPGRPGASGKKDLDLSNLFDSDGLLGDSDENLIPDRIDAVLSATGSGVDGAIDLAARLGLESAGITLPLGRAPGAVSSAADEPTLVVIGVDHPLIDQLVEDEKLARERLEQLHLGEGLIQVVPKAFGDKRALVVTGGDAAGVARALEQLAERFPYLAERGKGHATVDDVEQAVWSFLSQASPGGQAAAALYKLDRLVEELQDKSLEAATVTVSLEKVEAGLEAVVRERLAALGIADLDVVLDDRDVQNAGVIFEEDFPISSEVDEFWSLFRERVLPATRRGQAVRVEARLSEPLAVRAEIAEQARAELVRAGADASGSEVIVLSAYKQGFSWLREVVLPQIAAIQQAEGAAAIGGVRINFAETAPPEEWRQQAMYSKVRWLKEIWPIAEVLTGSLELDPELIDFEMAPIDAPTYEVIVTGADGAERFRRTFDPKYVLRPYFDRFADYEMVRVTTGWLSATSGDRTLLEARITTDMERFWDHYQSETLPAMYDYIMELHEGNPRGTDAPYFGELSVEVSLSEPDYLLGIDNEYVSSMDSLHEEVYFGTLFFFRLLGRMARGQELGQIGRVIPVMRPIDTGEAGWAKIRFSGFATSRPAVVIDYTETNGRSGQARRDIPRVDLERPSALAATVLAGSEGLDSIDLRVQVHFEHDERAILLERADEYAVDSSVMSATQATAMIDNLEALRARGLYAEELAFEGIGTIRLAAGWDWDIGPETQVVASLGDNGVPLPRPTVAGLLPSGESEYGYSGEELVQWDTPIPPPEGHAILARMATFPEASVYRVGHSYLGKDIWAMDLMSPIEASHWSQYKATTFKPTVVYSARQHANEVSSTSHVLKLAELMLTDDEFRKKLLDVNVVIHPFTNPDGAQLAYDLYKITPDFILHAGYLGALGADATTGGDDGVPIYPEARVRPTLWRTWLPDIFLNPHGYPSHEVVQLFSEYAGLVRRGRITERNWSVNRGWFIPGFAYTDDPRFPRHKDAAFKIRDYITRYINADDDVRRMNERAYARYRRYGRDFETDVYRQELIDGVNIQMPIRGRRAGANPFGGFNPRVTIWSGGTEAPDEPAYGDWMKLVASAGLQWDKAVLDYLYEGEHEVERNGAQFWGGAVRLWHHRDRPPEVEEETEVEEDTDLETEPPVGQ